MNKTLLITGGASGIGAETARQAATLGYRIALNYWTRDSQAKKVVADIEAQGGKAIALPGDMAREADIVRLFAETEKALGPVTHLVNSAGTNGKRGRVDEYDAEVLANLFALGLLGIRWSGEQARMRRIATACSAVCGAAIAASVLLVGAQGGQRWDAAFAGLFQRLAVASITVLVCALAAQLLSARPAAPRSTPHTTAPPSLAPG